jgi:hypothetical protein
MNFRKILAILICVWTLLGFALFKEGSLGIVARETVATASVSPAIQDFYVNCTWAGQTCQFSFDVTDELALDHAIFGCNVTQTFANDTSLPLSGTQTWVNVTKTLPSYNCTVSFQLWVWGADSDLAVTTGLKYIKVYGYNAGGWNTPYVSLIDAIKSTDSANNWGNVETYAQTILAKKTTTDLANMISSYANAGDWEDVLKWSAFCWKLGIAQETDIVNALGNFTMVGSLPYTDSYSGIPDFLTESKWALYGYYWSLLYDASLTKWNVTAAFTQFNSSIYRLGKPALWVFADGTARTYSDRYYDEDASTIECYIIFAELLNVSGALDDALHWWNYDDSHHWSSTYQYFRYTTASPDDNYEYECEAPFFLKIIGTLKCYFSPLENWSHVLIDIENRFLSSKWNSPQWTDGATGRTTYVVVHEYKWNNQRRLQNTLGAWQALEGVYSRLNSTYKNTIAEMLSGTDSLEPAWALLLRPEAGLYNNQTKLFGWSSTNADSNSTAKAEILMFLLGMIPGSTTTAFPLEELSYEYLQDMDCQTFRLDLTSRTVTLPVAGEGSMTFQYGVSPVTYYFNQGGVWQLTFTDSWNVITNGIYMYDLPGGRIYFGQIPAPEITVTGMSSSKTIIGRGYLGSVTITIDALNLNSIVNLTVHANSIEIHSELVTLITHDFSLNFECNTTGFAYGNYLLEAHAELVPADNTSSSDFTLPILVHVGVPGDVSSSKPGVWDGVVDMKDITYLITLFNKRAYSPSWNSNADVNNDGVINIRDIALALMYFNQKE